MSASELDLESRYSPPPLMLAIEAYKLLAFKKKLVGVL